MNYLLRRDENSEDLQNDYGGKNEKLTFWHPSFTFKC
jgi:hypothetical protein